jgi:phospho-N-acetylmuramoyl-pentapeptide-transferase
MASFLFAFIFVLIFEPVFIRWLISHGVKGQPIRDDGPKAHEVKRGTPTMGGVVIIAAVVSASLLFCDLTNKHVWFSLLVMLGYAYLGFLDDWRKVTKQTSDGLTEHQKLIWQCSIAAVGVACLLFSGLPTEITVPFTKGITLPLGIFFLPFAVFVVVGTSNAVNLTDGLDGLAIGPVMTVAFTYAAFTYAAGHAEISEYLNIEHIAQVGELSVLLAAIVAGGLGFLWYNTFPAQIILGDVGALALGGLLGYVAVIAKQEVILVVAGGVFVLETLSVIIQRYSYKLRKKRVFKMAPIHHHFELMGWAEPKIIVRFWIISIVLALISLSSLKLR